MPQQPLYNHMHFHHIKQAFRIQASSKKVIFSISLQTVQPLWFQQHCTPKHARKQASTGIQTSPTFTSVDTAQHEWLQPKIFSRSTCCTHIDVPVMWTDPVYSAQHHFSLLPFQSRRTCLQTETVSTDCHLDWARLWHQRAMVKHAHASDALFQDSIFNYRAKKKVCN